MNNDFARLGVPSSLVSALSELGITNPTPIQAATLPDSMAGRDVLGRGRTGSGKTYAFLLPLVTRLQGGRRSAPRRPRALILAPTRELASQIADSLAPLAARTGLVSHTVFGGVGQNPQVRALARGVDVLIACPGRLLDLMGQGHVDLGSVEITVIDEADHMADMGFLPMVRRILDRTPERGQRMLFSATLDAAVGVLVKQYLHSPVTHEADSALSPISSMDHHVLSIDTASRTNVVADLAAAPGRTIVFTRTKHGAKKLAKQLLGAGVPAVELHGNLGQNARTRNLDAFHSGTVSTLVVTDIAARGIHVDDVALVVHADPPTEHKAYLHRSGRTARAGHAGTVVTLMTPEQCKDVRTLMRDARISPTFSVADRAVLRDLAPGDRKFMSADDAFKIANPAAAAAAEANAAGAGAGAAGTDRTGKARSGGRSNTRSRPDTRSGSGSRSQSRPRSQSASARTGRGSGGHGRRGASPAASPAGSTGGAAAFSAGRR